MKQLVLFLTIFSFATGAKAQILNGGFEDWSNGKPNGWTVYTGDPGWGKDSSMCHSGKYCFAYQTDPLQYQGIISSRFKIIKGVKSFSFWYQVDYATTTPLLFFYQTKFHGATKNIVTLPISKEWKKYSVDFSEPIDTSLSSNDSMYMIFSVNNPSSYTDGGVIFFLDDVAFDSTLSRVRSIVNPGQNLIDINPNPISTSANLHYHLNGTTIIYTSIFDLTGRKVMELPSVPSASGNGAIPFDCNGLPNGLFYLRFDSGGNILMRKIIVQH